MYNFIILNLLNITRIAIIAALAFLVIASSALSNYVHLKYVDILFICLLLNPVFNISSLQKPMEIIRSSVPFWLAQLTLMSVCVLLTYAYTALGVLFYKVIGLSLFPPNECVNIIFGLCALGHVPSVVNMYFRYYNVFEDAEVDTTHENL